MNLGELLARCRETNDFTPLSAAIAYTQFLGISADGSSGELLATMRYSEKLIGNPTIPALHGGALGALLESACVFQVLAEVEPLTVPKTINITVAYLRSGKAVDTFAHAVVTKLGRRVANVHATAWQEDRERPIATAVAHFLISPREE